MPNTSAVRGVLPCLPMRIWHADTLRLLTRPGVRKWPPVVAVLAFDELPQLELDFGRTELDAMFAQVAVLLRAELADHEMVAVDGDTFVLTLCDGSLPAVQARLQDIATRVARLEIVLDDEVVTLTPLIGWTSAVDAPVSMDPAVLVERAREALDAAAVTLDLQPQRWSTPAPRSRRGGRLQNVALHVSTLLLGIAVPFMVLVALHNVGIDAAAYVYFGLVGCLLVTTGVIWAENFHALAPARPPKEPAAPYPTATAIIPAYLPNEADTIVETLHAVLAQEYPGELQVILAYNTPRPMPAIEAELRALAAADPRLTVLPVPFSTSKAQNVNAVLPMVRGEFVGVFDADHHPAPYAFARAWRWLSHGAGIVQGHCVIRNGDASWVARTIAVEFESIYAVSHPGRARLHGFGIFGGSNGFWRTRLLHETRMRGEMLTEDIDASIRALLAGHRVVSDPGLVSRELAPVALKALFKQRARWAQGWFQVSRRHLATALRSSGLSVRNKLGITFLLGWREVYPWLTLQVFSVLAFILWRDGGLTHIDWLAPSLLVTTLYTLSSGPGQVLFAWRLAATEIRLRRWWFVAYAALSLVFYTEFKNHVARVSQLRELAGERKWEVTPRQARAVEHHAVGAESVALVDSNGA